MIDGSDQPLGRLTANVPRYTSYPTANLFKPGGGRALEQKFHTAIGETDTVSVYLHIPYCDRMCWFCGCHTKQTHNYEPIRKYVGTLAGEIALLQSRLGHKPRLARLHLGGGSPSLLQDSELEALHESLSSCFEYSGGTEVSIELDPSDLTPLRLDGLFRFGMNRASIGVQDFDPVVQQAINRPQGYDLTRDVVQALRQRGIPSINIDMLYGLPYQTPDRLADTVNKVLSLAPERIALFGYAHVPWMKPHQKLIPEDALPQASQRLQDAQATAARIAEAGYASIGIDHFAKPSDSLAVAARTGTLRRNFQGYVADDCNVLLGLGASSISQFPGGFLQNEVASGRYAAAIEAGEFAYDRGIALNSDDRMRGWIIERIMCDFGVSKDAVNAAMNTDAEDAWSLLTQVASGEFQSLVSCSADQFSLKDMARPFARSIAAAFDAYFNPSTAKHSSAV